VFIFQQLSSPSAQELEVAVAANPWKLSFP